VVNQFRSKTIGILAIQGDYERHQYQLDKLGVQIVLVRLPDDLKRLDGLIIPGGESTTLDIMINRFNLREPLRQFGGSKPVFGTCAGMIMLAQKIEDNQAGVMPLQLMDIDVVRTGYGRQIHSFDTTVEAGLAGKRHDLSASFIRAPIVSRTGPGVEILSVYNDTPVLLCQGHLLAASFHPELSDDTTLMEYFLTEFP